MTEAIIEVTENGKVSLKSRLSRTTPERVLLRQESIENNGDGCVVKLPQVRGFSTGVKVSHLEVFDEVHVSFLGRDFSTYERLVQSGESMVLKLDGDPRGTEMTVRHNDPNQESVPVEVRI